MSLCAALTVSSLFAQLAPGGVAPSSGQTGHYEVVRRADGNGRITGALFALEPDVDAREGLQPFFPELGLSDEDQLRLVDDVTDELGQRHLRYRRDRRGIEVKHDQVRVHANREHVVTRIEMELSELSAYRHRTPRIAPDTAIERARQGFTGKLSTPPRATLVVLGRVPLTGPRLAYEVPIVYPRSGQVPYARDVYVDAADGRVLMSLSRIFSQAATMNDTALDGVTRNIRVTRNASQNSVVMQDRVTIPDGGVMVTLNGNAGETNYVTPDTNTSFDDPTAVSVHHVVRESVEFLDREYGWNTWDFDSEPAGPGGTLFAIAHEGDNLPNAFFFLAESGSQLTGVVAFGDGDGLITTELARCQDVATHEVAHGLVTATANLAYEFQSGALNESFADVFGWLHDQEDDGIGEDCIGSLLQTPLRDMCNPGDVDQPQPAHMDDFQILPNTEEGNFGGVHINSGIPNRAACISRDAIGPRDVGRIWFRALRFHLGPTSKFQDMVDATATACSELSLPTSTCAAVAQAWNTVGLEPSVIEGPTLDCPLNSTQNGTQCFCDPGFVPTPTGAGCVRPEVTTCPTNSHREGANCVCDECFQGVPGQNGSGCTPIPDCVVCNDPLEFSQNGACECIPGIVEVCGPRSGEYEATVNGSSVSGEVCCQPDDPCGWQRDGVCNCFGECGWDANDCGTVSAFTVPECGAPEVGNCGNENWAGRCSDNTLIFCDDQSDAGRPFVVAADCSETGEVCSFNSATQVHDCSVPSCTLPEGGTCDGNVARWCANGIEQSLDCGEQTCAEYTIGGDTLNFCLPCVANAVLIGDECECSAGFFATDDGECLPIVTGAADGEGGSTSGGGCSATSVAGLWLVALLRRRRR